MQSSRFGKLAAAVALAGGALISFGGQASAADPCVTEFGQQVPGCVTTANQWEISHDSTQYQWLACPANAPYWWGSWSDKWQHSAGHSTWHSSGSANAGYFGLRNLWVREQWARVEIGCSQVNPGCSNGGVNGAFSDPGCPQSNSRTVCAGSDEDETCWLEWDESCSSGQTYACTQALIATYCVESSGC
jgi:hypothetical protein